jgi:hypothetical protein
MVAAGDKVAPARQEPREIFVSLRRLQSAEMLA